MTRPYHSASSIKLGRRCQRAWAYCYLDGLRDPEIPWVDIVAGRKALPRQRSLALGKAVHSVGEQYYSGDTPDWLSLPGQIYASGMHLIPSLSASEHTEVEAAIGDVPCEASASNVAMVASGINWVGSRDLIVTVDTLPIQIDYKTTSSIAKYALNPEDLNDDLQCALYTYDLSNRLGCAPRIKSVWLYLETKAVRRAKAVELVMTRERADELITSAADIARELDLIESSASAKPNLDACGDYGGCPYSSSQGGPCNEVRSIKSYFSAPKGSDMALDDVLKAKFAALSKPAAPVAAPEPAPVAAPEPAPAPAPVAAPEPAPAPTPALDPPKRGRPKAPPAPPTAPVEAATTLSAQLFEATQALAAAEQAYSAALARFTAILGGA